MTILDEPLGLCIVEETKKAEHRVSFTEQKLIDRGQGWQVPKFDTVPAGTSAQTPGANDQISSWRRER